MLYLYIIIGLGALLLGGRFLVDGASAIASRLNLSAGLIGLTIVALGTSAPELLVSVTAALKGNSDIAMGNVVGSNISNLTLVMGITALVYPILLPRTVLRMDYPFTLTTSILFFIVAYNGIISFVEGIIFLFLFVFVNLYFFKKIEKVTQEVAGLEGIELKKISPFLAVFYLLLGIFGLYWGAELLVNNSIILAQQFGVSERIIGVTVVAVGTSLPELATSVVAALKKETDIAIGNILGSNMMNVLLIIGVTASIKPIDVSSLFIGNDLPWMLGFTLLVLPLMITSDKISRWEGALLILGYGLYLFFIL
jgi:cation:H+ antiporter